MDEPIRRFDFSPANHPKTYCTEIHKMSVRTPKQRSHNEWVRPVSLGGRKSCPTCHVKLADGESIYSWGEYGRGKWFTVKHFCRECFDEEVRQPLLGHGGDCGCRIELVPYHCSLPEWLSLDQTCGV